METVRIRAAVAEAVLAYVERAAGSRRVPPARSAASLALSEPRRPLDLAAMASALDAAARARGDDAIGLRLAAGFEFGALGPFSYAVLHAPTLGTALHNLERYSEAVGVGARLRLEVVGETASLVFPAWGGAAGGFRQVDEAGVLFFLRMLRRLAGPGWEPVGVAFRHAAPDDVREHRRLLGDAVRFGQPSTRIRIAVADLDRAVRDADRFLLPIVERHLQEVVATDHEPDAFRQELELHVASLVCDGHPSIRAIAPRLGLSVRTLQRRLDERGFSYREVVAGVRRRIACHYLEGDAAPSLAEIAFLLGYSELSAFDRAFRRWTGTSPGAYRRSRGAKSGAGPRGRRGHPFAEGDRFPERVDAGAARAGRG